MGPMEANWKMSTLIDSSIRQSGSCHAHQTSCLHWGMTSLPLWDQHSNPQGAELEVMWGHNLPTGTLGFPEFLRLGLGTGQQPDVQHDEDSARRKANPVRLPHMENHQLSCTPGKAGWSYSAVLCVCLWVGCTVDDSGSQWRRGWRLGAREVGWVITHLHTKNTQFWKGDHHRSTSHCFRRQLAS